MLAERTGAGERGFEVNQGVDLLRGVLRIRLRGSGLLLVQHLDGGVDVLLHKPDQSLMAQHVDLDSPALLVQLDLAVPATPFAVRLLHDLRLHQEPQLLLGMVSF